MIFRSHRLRTAAISIALVLLQGCSTMTHFDGAAPGVVLSLRGTDNAELPKDVRLDSKATGQHLFKAVSSSGQELYGLLPLRVNGATMAGSIMFFAPALFIGGFRDAYPFYQFDPDTGFLRYKRKEEDEWQLSKPTAAERERAKSYFDTIATKCTTPGGQGNVPGSCTSAASK